MGLFPKYLVNDLIRDKLKENINLQDIIKKDDLGYKTTSKKSLIIILNYLIDNFGKYFLSIVFWEIYIYKGHLSLQDADDEQCNFAVKLTNLSNKTIEKYFFLK